jgi:dUTP pyrophosphatase
MSREIELKILDPRLGRDFPLPTTPLRTRRAWTCARCASPLTLAPGEAQLVPTGLAIHMATLRCAR